MPGVDGGTGSADAPHIPDKMFYKISDAVSIAGVEAHVLRYWETEFDELRPRKSQSGRRQYSRQDIENILEIKSLLYEEGFSISGAKKRLQKRKGVADGRDALIETLRHTKKGLKEILAILEV
ncbi:MAG: MerR family transcriptional regulator [Nitrospinae bacterium]|nr:MerR family transcriptional regulator [Nitrospinota bacterium]